MTMNQSPTPAVPIPPLRILYAEDLKALRILAQVMLTRLGHSLECFENGQLAWDRVRVGPDAFDLIITDHHMPVMNGLELVGLLRTIPFGGRIIVFSSDLDPRTAILYRDLKVDRLLNKPIVSEELRQILTELFGSQGAKP